MNHSDMEDLYELYLLNLLDAESAAAIEEHLNTQCEVCLLRLREAAKVNGALASIAPSVAPPARVRSRILQAVQPQKKSPAWIYAFAAAALVAVGFFAWGFQQRAANASTSAQISQLLLERNALRSAVAILSQSDMRTVQFGANQTVAHGRVFVSGSGGVVFVGSQLPELAADRAFEFWLIPAKGNPQPAGIFHANAVGVSVNVLPQPVNTAQIAAVAVSVEPSAGSPQPTTKPILIIPLA